MAGSLSAFKVGMIALASVAVIGAGVFGITQLRQQPDHTEQTVQMPDETPDETPTETETTPVYEPSEEEIDAALNLYFDIISSAPEHFPADSGAAPTGKYRYSITPTSLSDQIQTLLLGQETEDGNYQVRIFQYDFETESMIQPERILDEILTGDAEHAELTRMEGNVILLTQTSQRSGDAEISALALDGEELELESQWSGNADKVPERLASTEIHWTEISFDLSQYTPSQQDSSDGQTSTQEQTSSGGQSQPQQLPEEEGRIVFTGTIDTSRMMKSCSCRGSRTRMPPGQIPTRPCG